MKGRIAMSNKALLSRAELELTQRFQMLFPCGTIPTEALKYWNGCTREEWEMKITPKLVEMLSNVHKDEHGHVLRRLYRDEVNAVEGRTVSTYELVKNSDIPTMFKSLSDDLEKLWMTVAQRDAFCEKYRDRVIKGGQTFFLCKRDEEKHATPKNLFVSCVRMYSGGTLSFCTNRFFDLSTWSAENHHRLVVPALK